MTKSNCVVKHLTANLYDPYDITYNFLRIIPNWPADVSAFRLFRRVSISEL